MKSRATRRRQGLHVLDEMLAIKTAVVSLYRIMLKREPEDSEVDGWLQVARSHGFDLVVAGVVGSDEFEYLKNLNDQSMVGGHDLSTVRSRSCSAFYLGKLTPTQRSWKWVPQDWRSRIQLTSSRRWAGGDC